jgi:ABC-type uncharacterized transport system auxiliary subunit
LNNLSPSFRLFNSHLFRSGIPATGEMQYNLVLPGVKEVAAFKLGYDVNRLRVVTVMIAEDEAAAARIEQETRAVPQVLSVHRNGNLVMACTFSSADPIVERRVTAAFQAFQPALRTTT